MVDYAKEKFPCQECGKMVFAWTKHTYEDCQKYSAKLKIENSVDAKIEKLQELYESLLKTDKDLIKRIIQLEERAPDG